MSSHAPRTARKRIVLLGQHSAGKTTISEVLRGKAFSKYQQPNIHGMKEDAIEGTAYDVVDSPYMDGDCKQTIVDYLKAENPEIVIVCFDGRYKAADLMTDVLDEARTSFPNTNFYFIENHAVDPKKSKQLQAYLSPEVQSSDEAPLSFDDLSALTPDAIRTLNPSRYAGIPAAKIAKLPREKHEAVIDAAIAPEVRERYFRVPHDSSASHEEAARAIKKAVSAICEHYESTHSQKKEHSVGFQILSGLLLGITAVAALVVVVAAIALVTAALSAAAATAIAAVASPVGLAVIGGGALVAGLSTFGIFKCTHPSQPKSMDKALGVDLNDTAGDGMTLAR